MYLETFKSSDNSVLGSEVNKKVKITITISTNLLVISLGFCEYRINRVNICAISIVTITRPTKILLEVNP